jgi:predicted RNase H-like HicB family nuclease
MRIILECFALPLGGCLVAGNYTAIIQQSGGWWIGWVREVPGVNSQGKTREELIENLHSALHEALEMNRADALAACDGDYEQVDLSR